MMLLDEIRCPRIIVADVLEGNLTRPNGLLRHQQTGGPIYCPSSVVSTDLLSTLGQEEAQGSLIHSKKSRRGCVTASHAQPGLGRVQHSRTSGGDANLVGFLSLGNLKTASDAQLCACMEILVRAVEARIRSKSEYQNPFMASF